MKIVSSKPTITRRELEGVLDCLISDEISSGSTVKEFEAALANLTGSKYAVAANSATSVYQLVFNALGVDSESEVILQSYSDHAAMNALLMTGGKPVIVDTEEHSIFASIDAIKAKITDKTKAVVVSHLFGYHFDLEGINDITVPVIEDISHAIGTESADIPVGKTGAFTVISFSASMILTTGNGGMALTNNSKHYSVMRDLRYSQEMPSFDFTMTDIQAAMGISQGAKLRDFLKRRREIARIYHEALKITSHKPLFPFGEKFAYQSFPVIFDATAERVEKHWKKAGIEVIRPIEKPLHIMLNERGLDYPNSDRLSKKLYTIPIYPTLTKKDIEKIAKTLSSFI